MKNILLPDNKERSLAFYLAMEEFVAEWSEGEAFFVWRVLPTVIIGRNQDLEAEVNMDYCLGHGVRVVFDRYLSALTACLCSLGLDAEKSGRNDILVDGRKVSGNAFHQLPDRSIVHGTLLYDTDLDALEEAIRPPVEKLERHGVASVRQRVRNLKEYVSPVTIEALEKHLVEYFCDGEVSLTAEDVEKIEAMASEYEMI